MKIKTKITGKIYEVDSTDSEGYLIKKKHIRYLGKKKFELDYLYYFKNEVDIVEEV